MADVDHPVSALTRDAIGLKFMPNPEHNWDGNSLP